MADATPAAPAAPTEPQAAQTLTPAGTPPPDPNATPKDPAPPDPTKEPEAAEPAKKTADELRQIAAAKHERMKAKFAIQKQREQLVMKEQQIAQAQRELEDANKDPITWLNRKGVTSKQLAESVLKQTPKSAEEQTREEIAELKATIKQREEQAEATQRQQAIAAAQERFLASISEEKHPALTALYTPDQVLAETYKIARQVQDQGIEPYTDDEILEYLEKRETPRYAKLQSRFAQPSKPETASSGAGKPAAPPRTLSNDLSGSKESEEKPIDQLPEAEQNKRLVRLYEDMVAQRQSAAR